MRGAFLIGALWLGLGCGAWAGGDEDFLAARDAYRVGDGQRAVAYAQRLQGHVLGPYAALWELLLRLDDASEAEIRGFLNAHPDSLVGDRLRAEWLRNAGKKQNWALFAAEYPLLVNTDTELVCYQLQARLARGDGSAFEEARRLWFTGGGLPNSCGPVFDSLIEAGKLSSEEIWARLRLTLEQGNPSAARSVAERLPKAQGKILLDHLEAAAEAPQRFAERLPVDLKSRAGRELVLFALYRLARSEPDGAKSRWEEIQGRFSVPEREYLWGQLAYQAARRLHPDALRWYARAGRLSDAQLEWKVRMALRAGDWNEVLAGIQAMSDATQRLPPWRYWKGRALKAQGKIGAANAIFAPLSTGHHFYGQLAEEELGAVIGPPAVAYKPGGDEIDAVRRLPAIQRSLALYRLGMRTEAMREWLWGTRDFDDRQLLAAAEVARREDWLDRSINTANRTVQLHDFSLRFPAPHAELMAQYTRQAGLDDAWVYGLIRQESRFVPVARSSVGASGLMQLMPATARWVAKKLGIRDFRQSSVNEIDTNLAFGTYYLKYVLDRLDGQPVLATAAYNAGPGRAKRWRDIRPMEGAIYAETIPFNETRDYVQKVMSNAAYYAAVFGRGINSVKARLGIVGGGGAE